MPTEYAWFLPTGQYGDGHRINAEVAERPPTVEYLSEVARAAERAGFVNLLTPTGTHCLDAWMMGAAIAARTERIKFCIAFRPGLMSPVMAVQQANTFDIVTDGRLTVNVVTGSTQVDQKRYGDHLDHDARYARTGEFLEIMAALWREEGPVTFKGGYYDIENAKIFASPVTKPHPAVYLGGSSEAGRRAGAKHADVHMMWTVELDRVVEDVAEMRRLAAEYEREDALRFGLRMHVVCRETKAEARRAAEALIEGSDIDHIQVWSEMRNKTESEGQRRMNELGGRDSLWITDTLWMGVNTVRAGAGATLVGTPDMIAAALRDYTEAGASTFILSGWPHVEEAEIFGKEVMPLLKDTEPVTL
ncbi:MAG: LLM class flavin-dependent oxidoreductase [Nitrospinota bacterium]